MRIGIPSETKTLEGRVALVPAAAADLVHRGHEVFIQSGAGEKSGFRRRGLHPGRRQDRGRRRGAVRGGRVDRQGQGADRRRSEHC